MDGRQVASPAYRIRHGETIVVQAWSNTAVTLSGMFRLVYDDGTEDDFGVDAVALTTARALNTLRTNRVARHDGYVTEGVLFVSGAVPARGACYASAWILADPNVGQSLKAQVLGDYIYSGHTPTFGLIIAPGPVSGQGQTRTVTGTNPAAGAEVVETVPTGALWRLLSFSAVLVTDATVANRIVNLAIDDGTAVNRRYVVSSSFSQTASLTQTHFFRQGAVAGNVAGYSVTDTQTVIVEEKLPAGTDWLFLPAAHRIRTFTTAIAAGDDYAAPIFLVEEWVMPN